jgi:hypothetical protein
MLKLEPSQLSALNESSRDHFARSLAVQVQDEYPAWRPIPRHAATRFVNHGLARAETYGLAEPPPLAQFVHLMAAVAPNFDQHPAVHEWLTSADVPAGRRLTEVANRLSDSDWDDVAAASSSTGLHLPLDTFHLSVPARIAAALPYALGTTAKQTKADLAELANATCAAASEVGWTTEHLQFAYCAAEMLYGQGFSSQRDALTWVSSIFDATSKPATQAAMLRMRIALDFRVWV